MPPDELLGQSLSGKPTPEGAERWLNSLLESVFPKADSLIRSMKLEVRYKDVTYETLSHADFLGSIKEAFPSIDWDSPYEEFRSAGEAGAKAPDS